MFGVRYEDLVRHPTVVGERIFEFCGLDVGAADIRHTFKTDEIGHWKHYQPYLDKLRQTLGGLVT